MGWNSFIDGEVGISKKALLRFMRDSKELSKLGELSFMLYDLKDDLDLDEQIIIALAQSAGLPFENPYEKAAGISTSYSFKNDRLIFHSLEFKNNRFDKLLNALVEYKDIKSIDVLLYRNYGQYSGMWIVTALGTIFLGNENGDISDLWQCFKDFDNSNIVDDIVQDETKALAKAIQRSITTHISRQNYNRILKSLHK